MEIIREDAKVKDVIYFDDMPKMHLVGNISIESFYNYSQDKPTELGKLVLSDSQISELSNFDYLTIGVDVYVCLG